MSEFDWFLTGLLVGMFGTALLQRLVWGWFGE